MFKRFAVLVFLVLLFSLLTATEVSSSQALRMASAQLSRLGADDRSLAESQILRAEQRVIAYLYPLNPKGFMVISAHTELPPLLAYSLETGYESQSADNPLLDLLRADIPKRLRQIEMLPESKRAELSLSWTLPLCDRDRDFEQWPPAGYSPTGGWVKTEWTQSAPFNNLCPSGTPGGAHSVAGCPAVAMAQIVNYHECINGTIFINEDDYHHNYGGASYWIDDDSAAWGFPSWSELNGYLYTLMQHYKYQQPLTETDMAALVYACGAAAHQVYNPSGSGTFAVSQAYTAYQRFGFSGSELITDSDPQFYPRIVDNIQNALPVHLAIVNQDWSAGHNVVIDGYNTDQFYHLNFGWGGSYSGWYLLPSQIPYSLTVIEGAIVDIRPRDYLINVPETLVFNTPEDVYPGQQMEFINLTQENLLIEAIPELPYIDPPFLVNCSTVVTLPYMLPPGQSLYVTVSLGIPVKGIREMLPVELRLIHQYGVKKFSISVNSELSTAVDDETNSPLINQISCHPNPFSSATTIRFKGKLPANLDIFNLKGQKLRSLSLPELSAADAELVWDGKAASGLEAPPGLYLIKSSRGSCVKVLKY